MINVIKEDGGNRSILLEITNLTQEQLAEVTKELYKNGGSTCSCGQYIMVCFGKSRANYEKMVELVEDIKKKYVSADIFIKEKRDNARDDGVVVSTTTEFSTVEVPLCEDAQMYFYDRPTARFTAKIWTDPTYGSTGFTMDSIDDYGWSASTKEFLDPEKVKKIMLGYIEQLPDTGASEENWKAYFCDKLGFDFDTLC